MVYDTIIIGGGPSGLSAAISLAAEGVSVAVLEKKRLGGAVATSRRIRNYPCGLGTELSGSDFAHNTEEQARQFGVALFVGPQYRVVELIRFMDGWRVYTDEEIYDAKSVVIAIGTAHRSLNAPGLVGDNVIYDGEIRPLAWPHQRIVVIGGGNSAGQAVEHLYEAGAAVYLLAHHPIASTMSNYLVQAIVGNVSVKYGKLSRAETDICGQFDLYVGGKFWLGSVTVVYVFAGQEPNTTWLDDLVERDAEGYVTGVNAPGLFVVGDVKAGAVRRLACAIGSGGAVVPEVYQYVKG